MMDDQKLLSGQPVSRETIEKLTAYAELLKTWTKSINLIAPNSIPEIWHRHIEDSAQLAQLAPQEWETWTDIGSGGGLPAIVIAILDQKERPVTMIESDQRKCLFLKTVKRELDLNLTIVADRIEKCQLGRADVLSARALASLDRLLEHSLNLMRTDGCCMFMKGSRYQDEIALARKVYDFDVVVHPSQTHSPAGILQVSRINRREH